MFRDDRLEYDITSVAANGVDKLNTQFRINSNEIKSVQDINTVIST